MWTSEQPIKPVGEESAFWSICPERWFHYESKMNNDGYFLSLVYYLIKNNKDHLSQYKQVR